MKMTKKRGETDVRKWVYAYGRELYKRTKKYTGVNPKTVDCIKKRRLYDVRCVNDFSVFYV